MLINELDKLEYFDEKIFRNTPIFKLPIDEFDDLADNVVDIELANNVAKKADTLSNKSAANDADFHAISYIFSANRLYPSRFGDGSFPVWYGSIDEVTTCYETSFHIFNKVLADTYYSNSAVCYRSMFSVNCTALLIDIRKKTKKYPQLIDPDTKNYMFTQKFSKQIYKQGYPGLHTMSARNYDGENLAVYKESVLSKACHLYDIIYEKNSDTEEVVIKNQDSGDIILKI